MVNPHDYALYKATAEKLGLQIIFTEQRWNELKDVERNAVLADLWKGKKEQPSKILGLKADKWWVDEFSSPNEIDVSYEAYLEARKEALNLGVVGIRYDPIDQEGWEQTVIEAREKVMRNFQGLIEAQKKELEKTLDTSYENYLRLRERAKEVGGIRLASEARSARGWESLSLPAKRNIVRRVTAHLALMEKQQNELRSMDQYAQTHGAAW